MSYRQLFFEVPLIISIGIPGRFYECRTNLKEARRYEGLAVVTSSLSRGALIIGWEVWWASALILPRCHTSLAFFKIQ